MFSMDFQNLQDWHTLYSTILSLLNQTPSPLPYLHLVLDLIRWRYHCEGAPSLSSVTSSSLILCLSSFQPFQPFLSASRYPLRLNRSSHHPITSSLGGPALLALPVRYKVSFYYLYIRPYCLHFPTIEFVSILLLLVRLLLPTSSALHIFVR